MYIKDKRRKNINELEFDSGTDYTKQLKEIMPRGVLKEQSKSRRNIDKQKIWKKRRIKSRSGRNKGRSSGPEYY